MDYIELKRTLVAAFDHFLSCHDTHDLEEMMLALETGKQLVIGFPEPIHREDYQDDIAMMVMPVKKNISRIRRKKLRSHHTTHVQAQKHICDIPIVMDLSVLSGEKQKQLCKALDTDQHNVILQDVMIKERHILAVAKVSVPVLFSKESVQKSNWFGTDHELVRAKKSDKMLNRAHEIFYGKKQFDPP